METLCDQIMTFKCSGVVKRLGIVMVMPFFMVLGPVIALVFWITTGRLPQWYKYVYGDGS